jgi:hypothetical protein
MSDGFVRPGSQANDPFVLPQGDRVKHDFETARGAFEEDPEIQFGVDWTRAGLTDSGVAVWVATVLLVAFVLALINDLVGSSTARRGETGPGGKDPRDG